MAAERHYDGIKSYLIFIGPLSHFVDLTLQTNMMILHCQTEHIIDIAVTYLQQNNVSQKCN